LNDFEETSLENFSTKSEKAIPEDISFHSKKFFSKEKNWEVVIPSFSQF